MTVHNLTVHTFDCVQSHSVDDCAQSHCVHNLAQHKRSYRRCNAEILKWLHIDVNVQVLDELGGVHLRERALELNRLSSRRSGRASLCCLCVTTATILVSSN